MSDFDFEEFMKMIAEWGSEMVPGEQPALTLGDMSEIIGNGLMAQEGEGFIRGRDYDRNEPPGSETSGSSAEEEEDEQAESTTHADLYKIATSVRTVDKSAPDEAIIEENEIKNQDFIEVSTSLFFDEVKSGNGANYSGDLGIENTSPFYILYQVKGSSPQKFEIQKRIGWVYPYGRATVEIQTRNNVAKKFTDIMYEQFQVFGVPLQFDILPSWSQKTLEHFWKAYGSELFPSFMAESHDVVNCLLSPKSCRCYSVLDFITNRFMCSPYPKVDFPVTPSSYDLDVKENFSESMTIEWAQRTQLVGKFLKRFNEKTREITWKNKRIFIMCYRSVLGVSVCALVFGSAWLTKMEFWPDLEMSDLEWPTLKSLCVYLGHPKFICPKPCPCIFK